VARAAIDTEFSPVTSTTGPDTVADMTTIT